ncbi:hypothetical protein ACQ4LE_005645 [Meloidogyne hapla]
MDILSFLFILTIFNVIKITIGQYLNGLDQNQMSPQVYQQNEIPNSVGGVQQSYDPSYTVPNAGMKLQQNLGYPDQNSMQNLPLGGYPPNSQLGTYNSQNYPMYVYGQQPYGGIPQQFVVPNNAQAYSPYQQVPSYMPNNAQAYFPNVQQFQYPPSNVQQQQPPYQQNYVAPQTYG